MRISLEKLAIKMHVGLSLFDVGNWIRGKYIDDSLGKRLSESKKQELEINTYQRGIEAKEMLEKTQNYLEENSKKVSQKYFEKKRNQLETAKTKVQRKLSWLEAEGMR